MDNEAAQFPMPHTIDMPVVYLNNVYARHGKAIPIDGDMQARDDYRRARQRSMAVHPSNQ